MHKRCKKEERKKLKEAGEGKKAPERDWGRPQRSSNIELNADTASGEGKKKKKPWP